MDNIPELIRSIARVGRNNQGKPLIDEIEPFFHFFDPDGTLNREELDRRDGSCSRRELLCRFLLLNAVLDQGPDIAGVRKLLKDVTNALYRKEIRFLHKPVEFFKEVGIAIDEILESHEGIKVLRSSVWALDNQSNPGRYNLFMDNSHQVLNYAIFRWGVPLALPLLLEHDAPQDADLANLLIDYLETWDSAEVMSQQIKDNKRYGLGKAIGDKASHLFVKWMVSSFKLIRRKTAAWDDLSYEAPYDSNAGRVLWRTGYLLSWASESEYVNKSVVQKGSGKNGLDYLRVTNIRGMKSNKVLPQDIWDSYVDLSKNHLMTHSHAPKKPEIQRIQHAFLLSDYPNFLYGAADFDDGLIFIGTNYCLNHSCPKCDECPINNFCEGYVENRSLIDNYRT